MSELTGEAVHCPRCGARMLLKHGPRMDVRDWSDAHFRACGPGQVLEARDRAGRLVAAALDPLFDMVDAIVARMR